MSVVTLQNEVVHFEVIGRSRPVIFLHGWVGSWRYWVPSMQAASHGYRSYAIDLWGFGHTAWNPTQYALVQQSELLHNFIDAMGIGRIALVGHGLGASVALTFAHQFPEIVDRLMLSSLPTSENSMPMRLHTASVPELVDWLYEKYPAQDPSRLEALRTDPAAIHTFLDSLSTVSATDLLQNLSAPSLLVYGQWDPISPLPSSEVAAAFPKHIHGILFEQSGHFPMMDESNQFNRLLMDFLSLASGESPHRLQLKEEWKRRVR